MSNALRVTEALPDLSNAPELRRLKITHRRALTLHLMGLSSQEVADRLGKSYAFVHHTIRSKPGQAFLARAYELVDDEIKALLPGAVNALRRNLDCGDGNIEISAADKVMKLNKKYDMVTTETSIEDVIERVMDAFDNDGNRVRLSERRIVRRVLRSDNGET